MVKQIVREPARQWKEKKVYSGLMDFFNLTLPCGDDCPIRLATAKSCFLNSEMKYLTEEVAL
jgi:hypothetical protein